MFSKGPRSPQILKRSLKSAKNSECPQTANKVIISPKGPQKGHQSPHDLRCSNDPEKVLKFLNVLKGSTKSSYPQNVIKVLKTSLKYSQIPQVLSRSSDPRNVLNVPKVLESPQKQLKVHRFSGPQLQERS